MASHNELGKAGEAQAIKYLESIGYSILEVNFRIRRLEIDIIAKDKEELVIVEVKTRRDNTISDPETAVTKKKQSQLIAAAHYYIVKHQIELNTRFDIISITKSKSKEIEHIPNAFYPSVH